MGSNDLLQDGKLSQKQVSVFGSIKDAQAAHKAHDDNAKPVAPCMLQRVGVASTQLLHHACSLPASHTRPLPETICNLCVAAVQKLF